MGLLRNCVTLAAAAALLAAPVSAPLAQSPTVMERVPDRQPGEGEGPYRRLVIRSAMLIDGTGAPPRGPVDIVVAGNRIESIRSAGNPGLPIPDNREPRDADREIDARGMYVLPGFVDVHGHNGDPDKAANATYGYRLWLAHGVTTVRGVGLYGGSGPENMSRSDRARAAAGQIVAPRLFAYCAVSDCWPNGRVTTPEQGRAWVQWLAANGYDGVKLFNSETPDTARAIIEEARRLRLGTVAHLGQGGVAEVNADIAAGYGLRGITHFYGHFESLLEGRRLPAYPMDYNMADEQWRFSQVARLADQIVEPGSEEWQAYLQRLLERDVTMSPTFNIYSAGRDVMRARTAEWHDRYTLPSLQRFFEPSRVHHGSYFWNWTTHDEVAWRRFFQVWMRLVNDYKNMGGRVTVGSDPGYIYQSWGFPYIAELEMLQEAGFSPLEVIQAATRNGAEELYAARGEPAPFGMVRPGMAADLVIVPGNPLQNLKLLYGTRHEMLSDDNRVERVGGVRWTVANGIVYDAPALLESVARMVEEQRAREAR